MAGKKKGPAKRTPATGAKKGQGKGRTARALPPPVTADQRKPRQVVKKPQEGPMVGAARVEGMVEELFEVWSAGGPSKDLAVIAKTWLLLDEAGQSDVRRWLLHASKEKEAEVDALFALVVENDREGAEQGLEGLGLLSGPRLRMAGRDNLLYLGVLEAKRQQLISYGGKEARDVYAKVVQEWQAEKPWVRVVKEHRSSADPSSIPSSLLLILGLDYEGVEAKDRQAKEEKRAKEEQEARERAIYLKGFEAGLAKGKAQGNAPALPQPPIAASDGSESDDSSNC